MFPFPNKKGRLVGGLVTNKNLYDGTAWLGCGMVAAVAAAASFRIR